MLAREEEGLEVIYVRGWCRPLGLSAGFASTRMQLHGFSWDNIIYLQMAAAGSSAHTPAVCAVQPSTSHPHCTWEVAET